MKTYKNTYLIQYLFALAVTVLFSTAVGAQEIIITGNGSLEVGQQDTYSISTSSTNISWSILEREGQINSGRGTTNVNITASTGASFTLQVQLDGGSGGFGPKPIAVPFLKPDSSFTLIYNNCEVDLDALVTGGVGDYKYSWYYVQVVARIPFKGIHWENA